MPVNTLRSSQTLSVVQRRTFSNHQATIWRNGGAFQYPEEDAAGE